MTTPATDPDTRRSRLLCYIAAAVFAASGLAFAVIPLSLAPVVRGVLAGFHLIIALAVVLYGRQLR